MSEHHGNLLPMVEYEKSDNDHTYLKRYRDEAAVAISPFGFPIALRYSGIALLTNPETTRQLETEAVRKQGITSGPIFEAYNRSMLFSNGAVHKNRRGPVARTFSFKLMEGMRTEIAELATEIVTSVKGAGAFNFLDAFAGDIPARIIARILGVPEENMPRFRKLTYSVTRSLRMGFDRAEQADIERDSELLVGEVDRLIEDRRAFPRDDFISKLLADAEQRFELSDEELLWQVITLIVAGSDTTRLALCSTLALLLQHPEQWETFCADPDGLKANVVREGVRYEPPIGSFARIATVDVDLDGATLPAGSPVSVCLLSAMRDESVYRDPAVFDIARGDHPRWHPAFGIGEHRCLGEALARAELEECLAVIARLAPGIRLTKVPKVRGLNGIRRIDQMWVEMA
ncbi:MAG: cytochrome P450 [Pseudomonadota bacterium]